MHIHILSSNGEAKYWLEPEIALAKSFGYSNKQLSKVEQLIRRHQDELINAWQQHFKN